MSDNDKQAVLLMAIDYLKIQHEALQNPCAALIISRYYRLLSLLNIAEDEQESYIEQSKAWLACHINSPKHSQKTQNRLENFVQLHELSPLLQ